MQKKETQLPSGSFFKDVLTQLSRPLQLLTVIAVGVSSTKTPSYEVLQQANVDLWSIAKDIPVLNEEELRIASIRTAYLIKKILGGPSP